MKENTYDEAYDWVKKVLEKYPKSEELIKNSIPDEELSTKN